MVEEPALSRDHTERMLRRMGADLSRRRAPGLDPPVAACAAARSTCPGDISSAAFFLCAAAALPGSEVTVARPGDEPHPHRPARRAARHGRRGEVAKRARERRRAARRRDRPRRPSSEATDIEGALVPRLIDELPVLMVLATQARGRTVIRDARELRVKESDRLAAMGETLAAAGARIELFDDGCAIEGPTPLRGVSVRTRLDHRVAMSMAVAQLFAGGRRGAPRRRRLRGHQLPRLLRPPRPALRRAR